MARLEGFGLIQIMQQPLYFDFQLPQHVPIPTSELWRLSSFRANKFLYRAGFRCALECRLFPRKNGIACPCFFVDKDSELS